MSESKRHPRFRSLHGVTGAVVWALTGLIGGGASHLCAAQTSVGPVRQAAQASGQGLDTEAARVVHLLQRATFGARPEDVERVMDMGRDEWLDWQLDPGAIDDEALQTRIAERFPAALQSVPELLERYPPNQVVGSLRRIVQDSTASEAERTEAREVLRRSNPGQILQQLVGARLTRAAHSERQLEEMMTQFWFDHFNVDFRKNQLRWLVSDYESNAIRPNVFGSFYELLVATATHPAMLVYLDNAQSVAPQTIPVRGRSGANRLPDRVRERGLNENYARELLELHTLGVDGGYSQEDVTEVARAFTGWGISPPRFDRGRLRRMAGEGRSSVQEVLGLMEEASYEGAFQFRFRSRMHDPDEKLFMGRQVDGSTGMDDALAILQRLATHPSTARNVATQLVTRFVSDDPPAEMVRELEEVFLETDGDLGEVTRALFASEHFYASDTMRSKIKSPTTLISSALRATGAEVVNVRGLSQTLTALGEPPYLAEAPIGYPERSADWVSGGAMLNRMDFGQAFAEGQLRGIRIAAWPRLLGGLDSMSDPLASVARRLLPGAETDELVTAVREALAEEEPASPRETATRAVGLILGSPEFQRH